MLVGDVFVCHASQDRVVAEAAVVALEARGIRCWIAPRDVPPGSDYAAAILAGISGSQVLLLVFSGRANDSPHVPREVERAVNRGIAIVPFRLDDVAPSGPLEYFISGAQWLDASSGRPEDHLTALVDAIGHLVRPASTPSSASEKEEFSHEVREELEAMIFRYGTDLASDPRRLQAVLRDMVGEHPAEISALVTAAEEGVAELLLQSSDPGASATMERLARRLKERRALGVEASQWAVASWARALRILPPTSESMLEPDETRPVADAGPAETRPVELNTGPTATVAADQPAAPVDAPSPEVPPVREASRSKKSRVSLRSVAAVSVVITIFLPWFNGDAGGVDSSPTDIPAAFLFNPDADPSFPNMGTVMLVVGAAALTTEFVDRFERYRRIAALAAVAVAALFLGQTFRLWLEYMSEFRLAVGAMFSQGFAVGPWLAFAAGTTLLVKRPSQG